MSERIPLYVAITTHGFGHATRTAAVIDRLQRQDPRLLPIFVTAVPRWLLEKYMQGEFLHRPRRLDMGVIQADSLSLDLASTLQRLKELQERAAQLVAAEADFIRTNRIRLVFADVPPLAAAIAQAAGIPCWMMSNFGWDFIYREYGPDFQPFVEWIQGLYGQVERLFQLPMSEPMLAFPSRQAVGLVGGEPRLDPAQLRADLGIAAERTVVLLTFGGLGIQGFPYKRLQDFADWLFISFDETAPPLANLLRLDSRTWRPVDIMPICAQVISKPGFGTFSEAMRVGTPITCITRQGFAEAELLLDGLRRYVPHRIIFQEAFFSQPWDFLLDPFTLPQDPTSLDRDGNSTVAQALGEFLTGQP